MNQLPSFPNATLARIFWFIGVVAALIGAAIAVYGIISFMADVAKGLGAEDPSAVEPDMNPFIRAATVGFPIFFAGMVVAWLASILSPPRQGPTTVYTDNRRTDNRRVDIRNPGSVVWSERDSTIHGGVHVTYSVDNARQDMRNLGKATEALGLPDQVNDAANRPWAEARDELRKPDPDYRVVGTKLEEFTRILEQYNVIHQAGENIIGPLKRLAEFLGPFGKGILGLLLLL